MKRDGELNDSAGGARTAGMRIDKWLFAARFYKSRALASDAIAGGKVEVNDEHVKPSRDVKVGDAVRLRLGPYEHVVQVRIVSDKRGPATQAAQMYEETDASKQAREKLSWTLKHAAPVIDAGEGRPTKKDRRDLEKRRGR
jgi:ribosome-associated heat shock protein Hsp15